MICHIQDNRSVIVFFKVGHWSDAYRDTGAQPATNASFSAKPRRFARRIVLLSCGEMPTQRVTQFRNIQPRLIEFISQAASPREDQASCASDFLCLIFQQNPPGPDPAKSRLPEMSPGSWRKLPVCFMITA